jgi:hypothetical protein
VESGAKEEGTAGEGLEDGEFAAAGCEAGTFCGTVLAGARDLGVEEGLEWMVSLGG